MSPQITAAKAQGKALYDGTKADVWALGVLLCVSLIGKFPFEGDSVSTMGVNDPMKKVGGGEAGQAEGGGQGEELGSVGNAWMQQMGADNVSSSSEVVLHNSPASWILLASPPLL